MINKERVEQKVEKKEVEEKKGKKSEADAEKTVQGRITINELATFCKKKGFVYPSSEIYGGLAGFWDYGPLGVELLNNIKANFWRHFVQRRDDIVGIEASVISHPRTWKASGHIESFSDIAIECKNCRKINKIDKGELGRAKCEFCNSELDVKTARELKLLFTTNIGTDNPMTAYLRGETAQGMFLNFKLIVETARTKLPFGIAQIGKCFRNEIAPRDFLFRCREFTIGELEYFIHPEEEKCDLLTNEHLKLEVNLLDAETQQKRMSDQKKTNIKKMIEEKRLGEWHGYWLAEQIMWVVSLGIDQKRIRIREHTKTELSHYSSATFDIDYEYPFGSKELGGNANRGQYDLTQHMKESSGNLEFFDEKTGKKVIPKVIEPTFGMDRIFLAVLANAYNYDDKRGNVVLRIKPELAPFKAAVFPLLSNKPELVKMAEQIYKELRQCLSCVCDKAGSIGKRYARQDEIGTPFCITIDFESLENNDITIRDRDTTEQVRVKTSQLKDILRKLVSEEIMFKELK